MPFESFDPTFNPASLSPFLWLDPSDISTLFQDSAGTIPVTANNDPVGRINDKSGNGRHLIQATAANRPFYKTADGLRWLEFDGANDSLAVSFGSPMAQPIDSVDAFRLLSFASSGGGTPILIGDGVGVGGIMEVSAGGNLGIYSGILLNATDTVSVGQDFVTTSRYNAASSRIAIDTLSYTTGNVGTGNMAGLTLGSIAGLNRHANMRFFGRVQKSTFSDLEITQLRSYMAFKQGRTGLFILPSLGGGNHKRRTSALPYWWHSYYEEEKEETAEERATRLELERKHKEEERRLRLIQLEIERRAKAKREEEDRIRQEADAAVAKKNIAAIAAERDRRQAEEDERLEQAMAKIAARREAAIIRQEEAEIERLLLVSKNRSRRFEDRFAAAIAVAKRQGWRAE